MTHEQKVNKWVEENYRWFLGEVKRNIAKHQMSQFAEELVHELILSLYKMKPEKWDEIERGSGISAYVLTSAGLSLRSQTSPFYLKIRRERGWARENGLAGSNSNIFEKIDDTEETSTEKYHQCMLREIEKMHWYLRKLLNEYWIEGETLDTLHAKYQISKRHLTKDLNEAIYIIRENCKDC